MAENKAARGQRAATGRIILTDAQSTPSRADTLALWRHIYGTGTGYLATFTLRRNGKRGDDQRTRYYAWPDTAGNAWEHLRQAAQAGRETYMCAHLLTDRKRDAEHAAPLGCLYADGDTATIPDDMPPPTAIVESSPGRHHFYWRLDIPCEPLRAEQLNKRLAHAIGADPSGYDLSQLLRPPGFPNQKYAGAMTRLVEINDMAYDVDDLDGWLPELPAKTERPTPTVTSPRWGENWTDAKILGRCYGGKYGGDFAALWRGDLSAHEGNQSAADYALCRHLYYAAGGDIAAVDRLFRQSGLMRDKWDEKHYASGETYGAHTIYEAAAHVSQPWQRDARIILESSERNAGDVATGGVIRLADVQPEHVRWLWHGRIPFGKLVVLDGDPGLGKSTVTLDIAARVTTGRAMPDGRVSDLPEPAGVLLLTAEDGLGDTVRPRLDAAGADVSRVVALATVPSAEGVAMLPAIPDDTDVIAGLIAEHDARLVIIDPLMAYLSGDINSYRDQDVRRALAPLAAVAESTGAAIIVVRHLTKGGGTSAVYRGGGSIGIIGAARSGMLVAKDPDNEERRILAMSKANLAAPVPALAYHLDVAMNGVAYVAWDGTTPHTAAQLLAMPTDSEERTAIDEAVDFLRDALASGPMLASTTTRAARDAGISERTLRRARERLKVKSAKDGLTNGWQWSLPEDGQVAPIPKSLAKLAIFDVDAENEASMAAKMADYPEDGQLGQVPGFWPSSGDTRGNRRDRCWNCGAEISPTSNVAGGLCGHCVREGAA